MKNERSFSEIQQALLTNKISVIFFPVLLSLNKYLIEHSVVITSNKQKHSNTLWYGVSCLL